MTDTPLLRATRLSFYTGTDYQPWYYLQRQISAGAKFPPSPHLKLSHRGGCRELVQDPCMQTAVSKRLVVHRPLRDSITSQSMCSCGTMWCLECSEPGVEPLGRLCPILGQIILLHSVVWSRGTQKWIPEAGMNLGQFTEEKTWA